MSCGRRPGDELPRDRRGWRRGVIKMGKSIKDAVKDVADRIVTRRDDDGQAYCNSCIQPVGSCRCIARHVRK